MKILLGIFLMVVLLFQSGSGKFDKETCTCKGKKLYGRVKVVDSFADFKVRKVDSFADLEVRQNPSFATKCGEWIFVESFPDFTVQYVDAFPDFTIRILP